MMLRDSRNASRPHSRIVGAKQRQHDAARQQERQQAAQQDRRREGEDDRVVPGRGGLGDRQPPLEHDHILAVYRVLKRLRAGRGELGRPLALCDPVERRGRQPGGCARARISQPRDESAYRGGGFAGRIGKVGRLRSALSPGRRHGQSGRAHLVEQRDLGLVELAAQLLEAGILVSGIRPRAERDRKDQTETATELRRHRHPVDEPARRSAGQHSATDRRPANEPMERHGAQMDGEKQQQAISQPAMPGLERDSLLGGQLQRRRNPDQPEQQDVVATRPGRQHAEQGLHRQRGI